MNCKICRNWCRDGILPLTEHHKQCPQYNLEADSVTIVLALIKGIEDWASEEDGVYPKAWDAYCQALAFVGQMDKLRRAKESE